MVTVTERPTKTDHASGRASPPLRAAGVTKVYGTGAVVRRALDGVDLDVEAGRLLAIIGPSGSGKSTLLHLFGVLDVPTAGEIWFEGQPMSDASEAARTEIRRRRGGFVFQQDNLISVLNAT